MATASGLYSNLPRDVRGKQIRISELFRESALQANDIFHIDKRVDTDAPSYILLDAKAVIRVQSNAAIKDFVIAIEFDVLENGQRSLLGAFTGLRKLAEALTRRTASLPESTPLNGLSHSWDDFQVWRNGQCLGTAADVRNHYYINHRIGVSLRTRPRLTRNVTSVDVTTVVHNQSNSDTTPNASVALHAARAGFATLADDTPAPTNAPVSISARFSLNRPPPQLRPQPILPRLHLTTPPWLPAPPAWSSATPTWPAAYPAWPTVSPAWLSAAPTSSPVATDPLQTTIKPTRHVSTDPDAQLEDSLMRELFTVIAPTFQPERFNKKHTAIAAKDYIQHLQQKSNQTFELVVAMGVTKDSLGKMLQKMDDGVPMSEVMRNELEWSQEGPLGSPLGRFVLTPPRRFGLEEEEVSSDDEMEEAE